MVQRGQEEKAPALADEQVRHVLEIIGAS